MQNTQITAFIITGQPGVGKTTLIRKLCTALSVHSKLAGFYTEEVRANGQRIGFDVVTVNGTRGILARECPADNLRRPRLGKYAVYVSDFEDLALSTLRVDPRSQQLLLIDEIGKMELLSNRFEAAVSELLKQKQPILVTIPLRTRQPIPIVERLKSSPDAVTFHVTRSNRDGLTQVITEYIVDALFKGK